MALTQTQIYQGMSPAKKLEISTQLDVLARQLKAAGLRQLHPDWSEERVTAEVKKIFLHATS